MRFTYSQAKILNSIIPTIGQSGKYTEFIELIEFFEFVESVEVE